MMVRHIRLDRRQFYLFEGLGINSHQVTSADILARATEWATTSPSAANEIFNVTNGDYFRWINLWPALARYFNMPCGDPLPLHLTEHMADKEPIWNRITERYGLEPISCSQIVSWGIWRRHIRNKLRQHIEHDCAARDFQTASTLRRCFALYSTNYVASESSRECAF